MTESLPEFLVSRTTYVLLRGRLIHEQLSWWFRLLPRIGSLMNDDPQGKKEEREGFDYMDKAGIEPIVEWVQQRQSTCATEKRNVDYETATIA